MMFHADLSGITAVIPNTAIATASIPTTTSDEKPFMCPECHRGFTQKVHLKTHLMQHSGEKPFSCEICGRGFLQKVHLKTHMGLHIDQKVHACAICGQEYTLKDLLTVHTLVHAIENPFTCIVCKKVFTAKIHLDAHISVHCRDKPFACTQCGKEFIQKGHLKTHMMVHSGEKPYGCTQCLKTFTQKVHLHSHLAVHSGIKHFKCSVCDKEFTQKGNLDRHLRIHSGLKPFKCAICNVSFTQKANLKSHMIVHAFKKKNSNEGESTNNFSEVYYAQEALTMPSEVKLYRCNVCSKAFTRNGNLKTHMSVHSGDRPFQCSVCQKRFTQNGHLKKHLGVHSGQNSESGYAPNQFDDGNSGHKHSPGMNYYVKEEPQSSTGIKNECPGEMGKSRKADSHSPANVEIRNTGMSGKQVSNSSIMGVNTHVGNQMVGNNVPVRQHSNESMETNGMGVRTQTGAHIPTLAARNQTGGHVPPHTMSVRTQASEHHPANSMAPRGQANNHMPLNIPSTTLNARSHVHEVNIARSQASGHIGPVSVKGHGGEMLTTNIAGIRNQAIGQVSMNAVGFRNLPNQHIPQNVMGVRGHMTEQMSGVASDKIMNSSKEITALNKRLLINSYVSPFPTYHYHNPVVLATREDGNKYDENNVDILG